MLLNEVNVDCSSDCDVVGTEVCKKRRNS